MPITNIKIQQLTQKRFEPFGQVITKRRGEPNVSLEILNYWHNINNLTSLGKEGVTGYLETKNRDFAFHKMERHKNTIEAFIPLGDCSIFPVAPPHDPIPDQDQITAFILDGTKGVILKEGVWHWAPFPLSESTSFILLLKKRTVEEDIDTIDLKDLKNVSFRLTF